MYYEVNVSHNGRHLFATHERSIVSYEKLKVVVEKFNEKFPKSEGYEIVISEYHVTGKIIEVIV